MGLFSIHFGNDPGFPIHSDYFSNFQEKKGTGHNILFSESMGLDLLSIMLFPG
jgi:hypothetical protein